jgi:hypothetical protein
MTACTASSTLQLVAAVCTFLLAVLWLENTWSRAARDLPDDIAGVLRRRSWLNALVAFGAAAAAVLLL